MSRRWAALLTAASMLSTNLPLPVIAQPVPMAVQQSPNATQFDLQQIDALLAPVALYPDQLLTQVLMAATFPLQVVEASRWIEEPAHRELSSDALARALKPLTWDPSVKSLAPFPQVLSLLSVNLQWTQQLGYAFATQQADTLDSVQRLRRQAQAQGNLQSNTQQIVRVQTPTAASQQTIIIIEPARPTFIYVPSYNPVVVYGAWPYPAYPPVIVAPMPVYAVNPVVVGLLAFGAGVAVSGALWGWSNPNWNRGTVNINVNSWNNINVNRSKTVSGTWNATTNRPPGQPPISQRPPGGPVGNPARPGGVPPNAIGRPSVSVPANAVNRPRPGTTVVPPGGTAGRPNVSPGSRPQQPPSTVRPSGNGTVAGGTLQGSRSGAPQRPPSSGGTSALGGLGDGQRGSTYGQRGGQSRQQGSSTPPATRNQPANRPPAGGARGGVNVRR